MTVQKNSYLSFGSRKILPVHAERACAVARASTVGHLRLMTAKMSVVLSCLLACFLDAEVSSKVLGFPGNDGPGNGLKIVLISGDEEYRSEESLPMLAKILSHRHGFDTSVLFSWSEDASYIDPNHQAGIRGWEVLTGADLIIVQTRFRQLDAEGSQAMEVYLNSGKPVIGLRTATHAFKGGQAIGTLAPENWGLKILGETWVNHHGKHKVQGTRSVSVASQPAILQGVGEIYGPSDVYGVRHLTRQDTVLLRGGVTESLSPESGIVDGEVNEPMMALAWFHPYTSPDKSKKGLSFTTTLGASVDFLDEDLRRLVVNATYHLLSLPVLPKADVAFVDPYEPSFYGFWSGDNADVWSKRRLGLSDFEMGKATQPFDPPESPDWQKEQSASSSE